MWWSVVPWQLCSSGSGRTCNGVSTGTCNQDFDKNIVLDGGLICGMGKCATSLTISFDASMH